MLLGRLRYFISSSSSHASGRLEIAFIKNAKSRKNMTQKLFKSVDIRRLRYEIRHPCSAFNVFLINSCDLISLRHRLQKPFYLLNRSARSPYVQSSSFIRRANTLSNPLHNIFIFHPFLSLRNNRREETLRKKSPLRLMNCEAVECETRAITFRWEDSSEVLSLIYSKMSQRLISIVRSLMFPLIESEMKASLVIGDCYHRHLGDDCRFALNGVEDFMNSSLVAQREHE